MLSPVGQGMLLQRAGLLLGLVLFAHAGFRDRIQARNKKICKDRQLNQFFRKDGETNCAKVVKCVADRGDLKLIPTACSPPLVFDIDSQICRRRVEACFLANIENREALSTLHVRIFKHSATGDSITLSYIVAAWLMTRLFCTVVEEFCDNAVIYFIALVTPRFASM